MVANVGTYNAISTLRKQNIVPILNTESQKVGFASPIDEFLFGATFGDSLRMNQALNNNKNNICCQTK